MHIWTSLAAREAALLTILVLLGSGPASFLPGRTDAASRIALAPALGFCLGTCVTTTILEFAPVNDTYWLLIPLALLSAGVATIRALRSRDRAGWRARLPLRDLAALLLIGLAVTGPINATLHQRHTVGPAVFTYTDVDNYVAVQDAARSVSLHSARDAWNAHLRSGRRFGNLTQFTWSYFAQFGSNLDATPLDSNVNALLGLGATDTFAPFLTVLLLMGALGVFAAVRYFAESRTGTAILAGCLFGGALFLELWFDSYQAAIIAIGLVVPFLVLVDGALRSVLVDGALRSQRGADLVLIALVLATMLTVYPLYMALLIATAGLMIGWQAVLLRRSRRALRPLLRPVALSALAIAVMAMAFDPVAIARDLHYYQLVLQGKVPFPRVGYALPVAVVPGWIAQTREFWALSGIWAGGLKQILLGVLVPLLFLGAIAFGLRRYPRALALVAMAAVCVAAAEYGYLSQQSCTYCAERNLLPLGPIAAVLLSLGLCALLATPNRWARVAGILGIVIVAVPVAQRARIELIRFSNGSYFLDSANRKLLSSVPPGSGRIEEEGYVASVAAQAEQPLIYHLINERAPGRVSVVAASDIGNAIQYLDFGEIRLPPGPEFDPGYRYVLTRLGSVATDRRVIARSGGIALEERVKPLDVTPFAGLGAPLERISRTGVVWVQTQYPLQLYIVGYASGTAWARLTFDASGPVSVPRQPGVRILLAGNALTACVRGIGAPPERRVTLRINAILRPGAPPHETFSPGMPLEGLALKSMQAVTGHCVP
jgi:hypothetical protein